MSTLGRWLQPPPKGSLEQQHQELVNLLRTKERALETTSHDLKVKTAAMHRGLLRAIEPVELVGAQQDEVNHHCQPGQENPLDDERPQRVEQTPDSPHDSKLLG